MVRHVCVREPMYVCMYVSNIHIYVCIYVYIYIERERERSAHTFLCGDDAHTYTYTCIHASRARAVGTLLLHATNKRSHKSSKRREETDVYAHDFARLHGDHVEAHVVELKAPLRLGGAQQPQIVQSVLDTL
jgi:hypothetical protein